MKDALNYEVNFLTDDDHLVGKKLYEYIKSEFDLIRSWQAMGKLLGFEARSILDNFIALSLRKLLCDKENSLLLRVCPTFKMPPLSGNKESYSGEDDDLKLIEIYPHIGIKPEAEWIPLNEWLNEKIAWIEKDADSIPDAYSDSFYLSLRDKIADKKFTEFFECKNDGSEKAWYIINPESNKRKLYDMLKNKGYYDLTVSRFIRHIADKSCAHADEKKSVWISVVNTSSEIDISAISVFATQMIYAATKQIDGLKDYFTVQPIMETIISEPE